MATAYTTTNAERCREYRQRLKEKCVLLFGTRCQKCGREESEGVVLQFAHVRPTGLSGPGRGFTHRYLDILRHRKRYRRWCEDCHKEHDTENRQNQEHSDAVPF